MQFRPVIAKSQEFLDQHERQTLIASRIIIGLLSFTLIACLGALTYLTVNPL